MHFFFSFQEPKQENQQVEEELIQKESVKKEEQEPDQSPQEHNIAGFVEEVKNMIEKIGEVQKEFQSKELNGGAFDNLSEQDDKLKVGWFVCLLVCLFVVDGVDGTTYSPPKKKKGEEKGLIQNPDN